MSDIKYTDTINTAVDHFSALIVDWTDSSIGSFNNWLELLKNIIKFFSKKFPDMTDIEKTDAAVKVVVELCINVNKKYTENATPDEIETLKKGKLKTVLLIIDNPDILRDSVKVINDLMNKMDSDGDGKISFKEFLGFIFPCCCK